MTFLIVNALFITALVIHTPASALSSFKWEPLTTGSAMSGLKWNAVATSADGSKVVAAAVDGGIWTSTDSGTTWTRRTEGNALMDNRYWSNVSSSADGSKLLAVAYDGNTYDGSDVWTSVDGGATWTDRNANSESLGPNAYGTSASSSDGTKLIVGTEDGLVYRSANSGATWTEAADIGNEAAVLASNASGTKLAAGMGSGNMQVSTDSGATWHSVADPAMLSNEGTIRGLRYVGSSTIYASQYEGDLWKSTDDGQTWTNLTEDNEDMTGSAWEQLDISTDGLKVIVGTDHGSIWMTDDGGASWTDAKVATPDLSNNYFWPVALAGDGSKAYALAWEGDIWGAPADGSGDSEQGSDTDGVSAATEDAAPNGGDANNDGTLDSQQNNVSSFKNANGSKYVALEVNDGCNLGSVTVAAESSKTVQDSGYSYPAGLVNFTAACGSTTVKLFFYGESDTMTVRKFFPGTNAYSTITGATKTTQTIGGQAVTVVTYTVTDGGDLDVDGSHNGSITDPVGLGQLSVEAPSTGIAPIKELFFLQ
jgi:photosystem II stability/assembly factor-like uncharacterized protein